MLTTGIILGFYLLWRALTGTIHVRQIGRGELMGRIYRDENPGQFWWLFSCGCIFDAFFLLAAVLINKKLSSWH